MSRRFYAVQIGDDPDCGTGSTRKREAYRMARAAAKAHPDEEISICICTTDDNFCNGAIILQQAAPGHFSSRPDIFGTIFDLF